MPTNGIDLLLEQHQQVEKQIAAVISADPAARQEAFDELRRMLAVHEAAEELILRPVTRSKVDGGGAIADARMAEENEAKEALAGLEKLDASSPEFMTAFETFASDVKTHASNEETEEFPRVREAKGEQALEALGAAITAAEAVAPTHPHPSARTTTANLVMGPFVSIVDRVKDAIGAH